MVADADGVIYSHAAGKQDVARDVPMAETYRGVVPFLVTDGIRLTLLILFPSLTLWLVHRLT